AEQITEIQTAVDVTINIKQKANKTTKACVIKGVEKCASNIYKARNMILGIDATPIYADIPANYHMPNVSSPAQTKETAPTPSLNPPSLSSPLISPTWYFPSPTTPQQQASPLYQFTQKQQFFPPNANLSAYHQQMAMSTGIMRFESRKFG
ncbi:hypothetical protein YQE_10360, partial [Dendroctonus ponderosae]